MQQLASVKMSVTPSCWVIHDGAAGNRRQATALAEALALPFDEWILTPYGPWHFLAPRLSPGCGSAYGHEFSEALHRTPPQLVIGCGRQAALATRLARHAGAQAIQILDPKISPHYWNLVIAPEHDRLNGENVISMLGSLNPVNTDWLAHARRQFPAFGSLPGPRTAILLGGPTRAVRLDERAFEKLVKNIDAWLTKETGSLMLCGSARTPKIVANTLRKQYADHASVLWMNTDDGINPYAGVLAWADRIVTTADSVNMISEACSTNASVFIAESELATGRISDFIEQLFTLRRARRLEETLAEQLHTEELPTIAPVSPLQETARVAAKVRELLALNGLVFS